MDFGFDQQTFRQAMRHGRAVPDWRSLRARFEAAAAARDMLRELASRPSGSTRQGSFDAASARVVASFAVSTPNVNPTALANGKPGGGIEATVASTSLTGGRGTR